MNSKFRACCIHNSASCSCTCLKRCLCARCLSISMLGVVLKFNAMRVWVVSAVWWWLEFYIGAIFPWQALNACVYASANEFASDINHIRRAGWRARTHTHISSRIMLNMLYSFSSLLPRNWIDHVNAWRLLCDIVKADTMTIFIAL